MAGRRRTAARGVLALLLVTVLAGCAEAGTARTVTSPAAEPGTAVATSGAPGPALVDSSGAPLEPEYAAVVAQVHRALAGGDLERLRRLYHGDDWAGQAELLSRQRVRDEVLSVLHARPANLGEGYVYPAVDPAVDPATGAGGQSGYRTAFFLDYRPLENAGGALQWRGIKVPALSR